MNLNALVGREWVFGFLVVAGGVFASAGNAATAADPQMPRCSSTIGTLAVQEPHDVDRWWIGLNLQSPAALIKLYVAQSGCFTLVDRGKGLMAAEQERALAGEGEMRVGSNVGKGQMKAADYVLLPDLVSRNSNAGGSRIGGIIGGLIGHGVGSIASGISLSKKSADVVLTLTDVRSTEQVAMEQGHSDKTDIGWSGSGRAGFWDGFASGGASSYANTEIGQVIAMAYLDAYTKLVADLQRHAPNAKADNVQQAVRLTEGTKLYSDANLHSAVVRSLKPGMMLYPTGDKVGVWWKVSDELGNIGWVVSTKLELAR